MLDVMKTTGTERSKSMQLRIVIGLTVGFPRVIHLLQDLPGVRPSSTDLAVPQQVALRLDVATNQTADRGTEGLLLVRT